MFKTLLGDVSRYYSEEPKQENEKMLSFEVWLALAASIFVGAALVSCGIWFVAPPITGAGLCVLAMDAVVFAVALFFEFWFWNVDSS